MCKSDLSLKGSNVYKMTEIVYLSMHRLCSQCLGEISF